MATITAALVKELRDKTGAGMMDCKFALKGSDGDMERAIDWLRTKGLAKAAKKAGRVAAEGLVAVATNGLNGAVVEVNSETDFVARNEQFQELVSEIAKLGLMVDGDNLALLNGSYPGGSLTVEDQVKELVGSIGENMAVRRSSGISVEQGLVASYVHNAIKPGLGKIGVIVGLESDGDRDKLLEFGRKLAMHIAATNPLAVTSDELGADVIEKERSLYTEQARQSGKPDNIVEKMAEGRLRKEFFQQVVLLQQVFVVDGKETVEKCLRAFEGELGQAVKIVDFQRFALGEGIEKNEEDFASEVAAAAAGG